MQFFVAKIERGDETLNEIEYMQLLNCTASFVDYGKNNVLQIFNWEQEHLLGQTGKQATMLKSYKNWNEVVGRTLRGKGVELHIDNTQENTRFFVISQTTELKFAMKTKEKTDEDCEIPLSVNEIDFMHKDRGLILTALWIEIEAFQRSLKPSPIIQAWGNHGADGVGGRLRAYGKTNAW